jgi:hypothetical protein
MLTFKIQESQKIPVENMQYNVKIFVHTYIEHAYTRAQSIYI